MKAKIIDFEFYYCPECGYRVTLKKYKHLMGISPCPECNKGKAVGFMFFTVNPEKYNAPVEVSGE